MIKMLLNSEGSVTNDVTEMVLSVNWSGDINTLPRKIEVDLQNSVDLSEGIRTINFDVGNMVFLYYNDVEIFRGFVFKRNIDQNGKESFTAYDELIYATKNVDNIIVKDKTASDVIIEQLNKFGLPIGSIQPTTYKIPKMVFQNKSLAQMWEEMLSAEKSVTGNSHVLFAERGLIYMWTREKAAINTITIDNVISGSNEVSMEDTRTQVMVVKGDFDPKPVKIKNPKPEDFGGDEGDFDPEEYVFSDGTTFDEVYDEDGFNEEKKKKAKQPVPYTTFLVTDTDAGLYKYGFMQHIEEAWEGATKEEMLNIGNTVLAKLNKSVVTANIDFIGDPGCTTGRVIRINDPLTGIDGFYFITADSHTISGGVHKMSLQLSKNLDDAPMKKASKSSVSRNVLNQGAY